jgi:serine protease Do
LRRSTVQVHARERGSGSGVIWNSDGVIVTNAHVAREQRARVELWDGRGFDADVTARDPRRDLASLRIPTNALPGATSGDSSALRAGELVLAVGNPFGFIGALTTGVVHGLGPLRGLGRQNWVQAAIRLAPGNSGGPLADATGRVIGINTMIVQGGLALAIPSNTVADFLKRGASGPSLGIVVQPVPIEDGRSVGLLLLEVSPTGPAAGASLLIGDVLTGANGRSFHSVDDLSEALDSAGWNALSVQFRRGDRRVQREVTVKLAKVA